ncbi:MAG: lipopolysaccharide kinase InaA family protein [Kiritimatiellia bacterium]
MGNPYEGDVFVGRYNGAIAESYRDPGFLDRLKNIGRIVNSEQAQEISFGRNRNVRVTMPSRDGEFDLAVKCFGRRSFIADRIDWKKGSRARRTWTASSLLSQKGIPTPEPAGFLEFWRGRRLIEGYYLSRYVPGLTNLRDELIRLFAEDPECSRFMSLLECVAKAVRDMHDSGFFHGDLGNQNILLARTGEGEWGDVRFVDLNRFSGKDSGLSLKQRARDISRIYLPSDFLRVFKEMYFDIPVPREFERWERHYRGLYRLHSSTRTLRHPIRELSLRSGKGGNAVYPHEKDMWVWDARSVQPVNVLGPRERRRHYPVLRNAGLLRAAAGSLKPVWRRYRELLAGAYGSPVNLSGRIGVAITGSGETFRREMELVERLGKIPVLIRFYCHECKDNWRQSVGAVKELKEKGHPVSVALVQDRISVTHPEWWHTFVTWVLDSVSEHAEAVEVCHAINRVKWGIWDLREYRKLLEIVAAVHEEYPGLRLMGPAVIDFEYPFVAAALKHMPANMRFDALSHHLYVDRRGAPENRQGLFSSLEKFALARAIALWSDRTTERLIVSEVNWPLKGTGVYSPVGAPYESPGLRMNDPSVSEDRYADYMMRYLLIAICSGLVDRVFWWRLAAKGFGLVDDSDPCRWRERPAYGMLKFFLNLLGESQFLRRQDIGNAALFFFRLKDGEKVCVAYTPAQSVEADIPFDYSSVCDAFGREMNDVGAGLRTPVVSGRPIYFRGVESGF